MLTFSIIWVALAAAITIIAMMRRSSVARAEVHAASDSDKPVLVLAAAFGLILLTGFVYVGKFLVSSL